MKMWCIRSRKIKDWLMRKYFVTVFLTLTCTVCISSVGYLVYADPGAANALVYSSFSIKESFGIKIRDWGFKLRNVNSQGNATDPHHDTADDENIEYFLPPIKLNESEVCPETRLPGIRGPLEVNLSEIAMKDTIDSIFQSPLTRIEVHQLVSRANQRLRTLQNTDSYSEAILETELDLTVEKYKYLPGGHWIPLECKPKWKVAIIVPFRDRYEHLPILLKHIIPMLMRQRLEFAIFIIEQVNQESFNRAMLFNVGFLESLKFYNWDCFLFHDVDHIPENDRNYYGCGTMPRHFVRGLDKYGYRLPYNEFFGGVSGLTREQMQRINGFSNSFWGWGGEDDDLWNRVSFAGYYVSRPVGSCGHYKSIQHHHKGTAQNLGRFSLLWKSKERNAHDGLNNCEYGQSRIRIHELYVNVSADIHKVDVTV
ncbi:beta-1,4-galactosyltransferase 5-like [Ptychodera flava]|uniref:beta-1,4-galactosyltransferase 5-like n=1 Tax=Ptychodera flava TaxID=63121 RepID=UPI00396A3C7F